MRIVIPEAIGKVVEAVQKKLQLPNLNYIYGTIDDLVVDLKDMTTAPALAAAKYPLIWLPMDIEERHTGNDYMYQANVNVVIADLTDPKYRVSERLSNTFAPTLQPIYEEFLNQLVLSSFFNIDHPDLIEHRKIDRIAWGKKALISINGGGIDFVDAIELTDLNLNVKHVNCNKKWQI